MIDLKNTYVNTSDKEVLNAYLDECELQGIVWCAGGEEPREWNGFKDHVGDYIGVLANEILYNDPKVANKMKMLALADIRQKVKIEECELVNGDPVCCNGREVGLYVADDSTGKAVIELNKSESALFRARYADFKKDTLSKPETAKKKAERERKELIEQTHNLLGFVGDNDFAKKVIGRVFDLVGDGAIEF